MISLGSEGWREGQGGREEERSGKVNGVSGETGEGGKEMWGIGRMVGLSEGGETGIGRKGGEKGEIDRRRWANERRNGGLVEVWFGWEGRG